MELVNECYAPRASAAPTSALRFAIGTAASLIFPFAPHCGADVYERADRRARVGGAVAGRPTRRCCERDRSSSSCRSTARCATACRRRRRASREELEALAPRRARTCSAHLDGKEVVKVVVVPGKLVNFVVR